MKLKSIHNALSLPKSLTVVSILGFLFGIASFVTFPNQTLASEKCESIFRAVPQTRASQEDLLGARFLIERDQRLHVSPMVDKVSRKEKLRTGSVSHKPGDRVALWLGHLEAVSQKAQKNPRAVNGIKEIFYNQYVTKPHEVPQAYFDLQVRIARERGQGNIAINKQQITENVIADQTKSLERWIDYIMSPEAKMYPTWVKYWMLTGMVKLSKFNPETGSFGNRTKETMAPFPELNPEALAYVMDALVAKVNGRELKDIQDAKFLELLDGAQFGKMYGHALAKAGAGEAGGRFKTNEGQWVIYKQGGDHLPLMKSLDGHTTGWCTAGETIAKWQLAAGDFHVYYSLDAQGNPTIPRVAIRMEGEQIAEIRGVGAGQNLDPQISKSPVITKKMQEFGSEAQAYFKKEAHMKWLTEIEKKVQSQQALSKEDLVFLYEVNEPIQNFGNTRDPRIFQIIAGRDKRSDLFIAFGKYKMEEISLTTEEALSGKAKFHYGNLHIHEVPKGVVILPEIVQGSLSFGAMSSAKGIKFPHTINGSLFLRELSSAEGLKLPEVVNGNLVLSGLATASGLKMPSGVSLYFGPKDM